MTKQTVNTASKAYGYNYASLADIANAGFTIPKMRVKPTEFGEFVEYYDTDSQDWQIGSKIVIPDMKGSNDAQKYGSALTYARRYTVMMALGIASEDDKEVETKAPQKESTQAKTYTTRGGTKVDFDELRTEATKANFPSEMTELRTKWRIRFASATPAQLNAIKKILDDREAKLKAEHPAEWK